MKVHGCNCSIAIKTIHGGMDVPYSKETIREAISLLQEEAAIVGNGMCRAIQKRCGVTGCIVTPLTIGTAPLLLYLAMGSIGSPAFVSGTRDLYLYKLKLLPLEDSESFNLIQERAGIMSNEQLTVSNERRLFESCRVKGFELRIVRDEAIKLKLDICGERSPAVYPYADTFARETGERFSGENVAYRINGEEYTNIYGLTLATKKEGGTKTELWIRRVLDNGFEPPEIIDDMTITVKLLRDKFESRHFGTFRISVKRLVLAADETSINSVDTVIGSLRYYSAGTVTAEVFCSGEEALQ